MHPLTKSPRGPLRVAVMGTGKWGRNLVRVLRDADNADLAWIVDPDAAALSEAAKIAPNAVATPDIDTTGYAFDAAVIATPAASHSAHAAGLIARGKHVMVEKPAALSATDARDLTALAHTHGVTLMVGHQLVYHPGFAAMKAVIQAGRIGALTRIAAVRTASLDLTKEPGVLWSLAPHDIAMILALTEEMPARITCRLTPEAAPRLATRARIGLDFRIDDAEERIRARIAVTATDRDKIRTLSAVGTTGELHLDDVTSPPGLRFKDTDGDTTPVEIPNIDIEPLAAECADFLAKITTGAQPQTGAAHIVKVTDILEKCEQGREVFTSDLPSL